MKKIKSNRNYTIPVFLSSYALYLLFIRVFWCAPDYPPAYASNITPNLNDFLLQTILLGIFFFSIIFNGKIEKWKEMYFQVFFIFAFFFTIINVAIGLKFLAYLGGKQSYWYILFWFIIGILGFVWVLMDKKRIKSEDEA